jgi:transcriptional regulator with XRE-family HTH domain
MEALMYDRPASPAWGDISANIRAELGRQRRHGTKVADAIGMSRSAWRKRMEGIVAWRAEEIQRVAAELGVPVSRLFGEQ